MKIVKWAKKHKLLIIGIILYVAVYFISTKFPVWREKHYYYKALYGKMVERVNDNDTSDLIRLYMPNIIPDNIIIRKIPLEFLFYGIADIMAPIHFGVVFSVCLITYGVLLVDKILEKLKTDDIGKLEMLLIGYLFENVIFYPLAFGIRYMDDIFVKSVDRFGEMTNGHHSTIMNFVFLICFLVIIAVMIFVLLLPSIVNLLSCVVYWLACVPVRWLIRGTDHLMGKLLPNMAGEIITAVITMVILLVFNILFCKLLEKCQMLSIKPLKWFFGKFRKNRTEPAAENAPDVSSEIYNNYEDQDT